MARHNAIRDLDSISYSLFENVFDVGTDEDGLYYYDLHNNILFGELTRPFIEEHVFRAGQTWRSISQRYYNTDNLWWLILMSNKIQDAFAFPDPGATLKIIKSEYVSDILSRLQNEKRA